MLRFDYMHSDFHPVFLFLGESRDLADLSAALRDFAASPRPVDLGEVLPGSLARAALMLVPEDGKGGDYGLRREGDRFRWGLNAWQAEQIAGRIDLLVLAENKSGSDIFELGIPGEIPVKVSRGEFEDDFLVRKT